MAIIIPFSAMRFDKNTVGDLAAVTSPPYDIISPEEQQKLYNKHPFNVVRLELGENNDDDDEYNNKYIRSNHILHEWLESGILHFDSEPSIYIYGQEFTFGGNTHSCKGIMCLVRLEEFENRVIMPHEDTFSKAKTDRYNLICVTNANFSAVYSLYTDTEKNIVSAINSVSVNTPPETEFTSSDGVHQRLWRISDENTIAKIQNEFRNKQLFIADGHHRYAAALSYRNMMRTKNPNHTGNEPYNFILMHLVETDEPGLTVFPTHRLVKNVIDFDEQKTIELLSNDFEVRRIVYEEDSVVPKIEESLAQCSDKKSFALYTGKNYYYMLTLKNTNALRTLSPEKSYVYSQLDVTILHTLILDKILGIDKDSLKNQHNLTYTHNAYEAESLAKTNAYQCAFFLNPTKIGELKEICFANEKMPQKSTYFYPKIITGLIMNKF